MIGSALQARKTLHIICGNLAERKLRTFSAVFVIAFAVAVVMIISAIGFGFLRGAMRKAEEAFPPGLLLAKPRAMNISVLTFNTGILNDKVVARVRQLPGVEYAAPQLSLKMPLRAQGEVMGQQAETDAIVVGIDPVVVQQDVKPGFSFRFDPDSSHPVPVVLPRYFLDMYNLAYADSMGLPKINESFALGKTFTLFLGETYLLGDTGNSQGKKKQVTCQIVGLTSNPSLFVGALIPLQYAEKFNQWYTGLESTNYTAMHVRVRDLAHLDDVTSRIQDLGLVVESHKETLERFQFVARAVATTTALFAAIVVVIAAVSVFNTFSLIMNQRRGEVGLLRAVGGSRRFVTWLFVWEVAALGLFAGLIGTTASWILLHWADRRILAHLPHASFLPEHMFYANWELVGILIAGATLLSVIATLPVILGTTRTPPASLISEA